MSIDPFYCKCILTGKTNREVKIDWHHVFEYGGKQIQEKWAIVPVCERLHSPQGEVNSIHRNNTTKEYIKYLTLKRVSLEWLSEAYPKTDWEQLYNYLNNKYKNYKFMSENKKEKKKSKFKKCPNCKTETTMFLCPNCGKYIK